MRRGKIKIALIPYKHYLVRFNGYNLSLESYFKAPQRI